MERREAVTVSVAGGIDGDRYAEDLGHWKGYPDQEVTLIEAEDAETVGADPVDLRRNVVTRGISLVALVGRQFEVGSTVLHGMRPCLPCEYLEGLTGRAGLKSQIRGGLRARVVVAGGIKVGDAVRERPLVLDADMRAVVESAHLAFVATVTKDGQPNLSPKGTIRVLDDRRLFFLDIASPQTRKNIQYNPWMEINVVDIFSRRGYRFFGSAKAHEGDAVATIASGRIAKDEGHAYAHRGAIVLTVDRALPLLSPGYAHAKDEWDLRASEKRLRSSLDLAFEGHLRRQGPGEE
jgi:MOSC domain-containing protein YiiM